MCLQNTRHSTVLIFGRSTTGSAMRLVILGSLRKENGAGNELISFMLHDRPWVPSLLPDEQGWAVQAHIYTLSSFPCEAIALPCLPVLHSSWQVIRRTLLAQLLLQRCLRRSAMFVVWKRGEGGSCQGRQRGTWRQMAVHTGSSDCVGNSMWEVAQRDASFPLAVQAGLLLWTLTQW